MGSKNLHRLVLIILLIGYVIIIYLSFYLAYKIRFFAPWFTNIIPVTKGIPEWIYYKQALHLVTIIWLILFAATKIYRNYLLPTIDDILHILKVTSLGTILITAITFFYRSFEYSRLVILLAWLLSSIMLFFLHLCIKNLVHQVNKFFPHNILVVTKNGNVQTVNKYFTRNPQVKILFLPAISADSLSRFVYEKKISEVVLFQSAYNNDELIMLSDYCNSIGVELKIVPDILEMRRGEIIIDDFWGIPVFKVMPLSLHGINFYTKRLFDIVIASCILSLLFFPLILIALLIKINSQGPIFYVSYRVGLKGKQFRFLKFRSMVNNAETLLNNIKHKSDRPGPVFKMKLDPRVTRVGRWLRRFSIDELPQLFNVLRGEMSLVGPRPQVLWETEAYDAFSKRRLNILPGITGLWQVSGRADLPFEEMIKLDIYYIENWSLGLDIKILLQTLPAIFTAKGAY